MSEKIVQLFLSAVQPYAQPNDTSDLAAYEDQWEEAGMLKGVDIIEAAWTDLRATGSMADNMTDNICGDVLLADIWKNPSIGRSILLTGFINSLLPKRQNDGSYFNACNSLITFCRNLRAEHHGDVLSEQIISYLACAFGMALAVSYVDQVAPDWINTADLDLTWRAFGTEFHSAVFSCIDEWNGAEKEELERTLQYTEWSIRKRLGFSWSAYNSDKQYITGIDPSTQHEVSNLDLLDYLTSMYCYAGFSTNSVVYYACWIYLMP